MEFYLWISVSLAWYSHKLCSSPPYHLNCEQCPFTAGQLQHQMIMALQSEHCAVQTRSWYLLYNILTRSIFCQWNFEVSCHPTARPIFSTRPWHKMPWCSGIMRPVIPTSTVMLGHNGKKVSMGYNILYWLYSIYQYKAVNEKPTIFLCRLWIRNIHHFF